MEKKKVKPAPAAVKGTPQKSAPKKRRFLLKFLFVFFLVTGLAVAGLYQRWFPLDPELDAKIDPYRTHLATAMESADSLLKKMEPLLEKVGIGTKPKEQEQVTAPQTNFPLVELDKDEWKIQKKMTCLYTIIHETPFPLYGTKGRGILRVD